MTIYDYQVKTPQEEMKPLKDYQDQVVLIVNTASKCGFAPQLESLETLYKKYQGEGFTVLGFPCNQFFRQEPKNNTEIVEFCQLNYGVTFPIFAKIDVRGAKQEALYKYLIDETDGKQIAWNFTKFLVNRQGKVVKRYSSKTEPLTIVSDIELLLTQEN